MTAIREIRALPRPALLLLAGSAVSNVGSGLVMPLLVIYLSEVRGFETSLALSAVAITSAAALLGGLVGGWASDRVGRVQTLAISMALAAVGTAWVAFVGTPAQMVGATIVFGLGVGANASWMALLAEAVAPEQRATAFGTNFGLANAAIGVGAVASGLFVSIDAPWTFQLVYLLNALSFVLGGLIMVLAVRRGRSETSPSESSKPVTHPRGSYLGLLRNRSLVIVLLIAFVLFLVAYSQLEAGVPGLLVAEAGISPLHLSILIVTDTVVAVVAQFFMLGVIQRVPMKIRITVAAVTWTVFWAVLVVAVDLHDADLRLLLLCAGAAVASVGGAFFAVSVPVLVHEAAADHERGRANALYGLSTSIGFTLGPALVSVFVSQGHSMLFAWIAIVITLIIAILALVPGIVATSPHPVTVEENAESHA
ncbi:MFS transporter [Microbacterium sp. SSW1-49]|uniref:MFS transporter n=1 Tax=Microbacterium croceum TaxID=2851645 RepID=A0ABT0FGI4_9MICO|nr:MFS transporter [Microbacterium croceum]MCK2037024.1 MFS transporter [Microbacterium croceum]